MCDLIRDCFVTGKWEKEKDAANLLAEDDLADDGEIVCYVLLILDLNLFVLEELFGDFEDLETGETNKEDEKMDFDGKMNGFH